MFRSYPVVQGIDEFVPVDFYIPGCPPRPDAVLECLMQLQNKITEDRSYQLRLSKPDAAPAGCPSSSSVRDDAHPGEPAAVALATPGERFVEGGPQKSQRRFRPEPGDAR